MVLEAGIRRVILARRSLYRPLAGAVFGAGLSSLAEAATRGAPPSFGPPEIILFGTTVPVLPALFGLIGVLVARQAAPPPVVPVSPVRNVALTVLLALGALALVAAGERRPFVTLAWSIGLGFSGFAFIEMVASAVRNGARLVMETFIQSLTKIGQKKDGTDV